MEVWLDWIKQYADIDVPLQTYLDAMTMAGIGVEGTTLLGPQLENVRTCRVTKVAQHPDADKLRVCDIDVGGDALTIVTNAENVYEGAVVPVALHGAKLADGTQIKKGKLRGVVSQGMFCSQAELGAQGLQDYDGILVLPEDTPVGLPVQDVLGLQKRIIDFEIYANRPDRQSVIGIARETSSVLHSPLHLPIVKVRPGDGDIAQELKVSVRQPELCPRYMARLVKNVRLAPSPAWMQERLEACGVRPINNIVDITNYVMLEMGQPMHAFDKSCIAGNEIVVRTAYTGESIATLDDKRRELSPDMLLIADAEKGVGIAGVMGGANSEIRETTQEVVLESAVFLAKSVRNTAKGLGLATESSARFAKGVDIGGVALALDRAAQLIQELDAGDVVNGVIDICHADMSPKIVVTTAHRINSIVGTHFTEEEIIDCLRRVYIDCKAQDGKLICRVPSHRGDIQRSCDIAEEVIRMVGYDHIPMTAMQGNLFAGELTHGFRFLDRVREAMVGQGFDEAVTYSFGSPKGFDILGLGEDDVLRRAIPLKNPLGEDFSLMRTTLLPSMLEVVRTNANRGQRDLRLFETGSVYLPIGLPLDILPKEDMHLCLALCGEGEDFFTLKGAVEMLYALLNVGECEFREGGPAYLHPGQKAMLMADDRQLGYMGRVHPDVLKRAEISLPCYVAHIALAELGTVVERYIKVQALPKYQAVERDLAFVMPEGAHAGDVVAIARRTGKALLESVLPYDVYRGAQIGAGNKSVTFKLVLRAADRTLTDSEIGGLLNKIIKNVQRELGFELRA